MKKFATIHRANRWWNRDSPLAWLHPLSYPPTLQMRATLGFYCTVILDMDPCPTLCVIHNRILAPTSGFSDCRTGEVLLMRTASVWPGPLSVLSGPAEGLLGVPHHSCSILLQSRMVMSSLFWLFSQCTWLLSLCQSVTVRRELAKECWPLPRVSCMNPRIAARC